MHGSGALGFRNGVEQGLNALGTEHRIVSQRRAAGVGELEPTLALIVWRHLAAHEPQLLEPRDVRAERGLRNTKMFRERSRFGTVVTNVCEHP